MSLTKSEVLDIVYFVRGLRLKLCLRELFSRIIKRLKKSMALEIAWPQKAAVMLLPPEKQKGEKDLLSKALYVNQATSFN